MDRQFTLARKAAETAFSAMKNGTFGVGGLIVHNTTLEILHIQENRVIVDGQVNDPTAHGERQAVDWYYRRKAENAALPDPKDLTIVSSLDPCMMCAGSILASGFNVVSLGLDTHAGVDFKGEHTFDSLPSELAALALKTFSYTGVQGEKAYKGYKGDIFHGVHLTKDISDMAANAFIESLDKVRAIVSEGDRSTVDCDIADLQQHNIHYGIISAQESTEQPYDILLKSAGGIYHQAPQFDAALLTLPNGQKLMARRSQTLISPIKTPVIRLIQDYTNLQNQVRAEGKGELPHLKYCQITMLHGPGNDASDIATLGAYGSAMEGAIPKSNENALTFYARRQSDADLEKMIAKFPPLYTKVIGIKPKPLVV